MAKELKEKERKLIEGYRAYGMTKKAIAARMHISDRRVAAYLDAKEKLSKKGGRK